MDVCFLCDKKLYGERTQVCSSITPHSNILYPEKIAELIGDEVVVIVTPADHICNGCTSLLTQIDMLENDLKLVKNAMLSYIQKKYGILPPGQAVKGVEIVNGHVKAEEQSEKKQRKVPSGLTVGVSPNVTTAAVVTPVQTPLELLTTQQQQQRKQQQQQQHHQQQKQQQSPTQQESANKMKIYKCGLCTFKSKELGHVRFHFRTHLNKKEKEKPIHNQAADKALTPVPQQKKRLYRCQKCSKCFNSSIDCLDHIHKYHNQPTPSTSNGERETEDSRPVTNKVMKRETSVSQENNLQLESPMDVDKNQQDNNKGTVDTNMMLNDDVLIKGSANVEQAEGTENAGEGEDDEDDTVMPEQEEADQETPDSVEKEVDGDNANMEQKTGYLDFESMLATTYNDNPNYSRGTQNND